MTPPAVTPRPRIAIISPNTLTAMGLARLLGETMPVARVELFGSWAELQAAGPEAFVHYFLTPDVLPAAFDFFKARAARVILLAGHAGAALLPHAFRRLDPTLPEGELVKAFLRMEQAAHGHGQHMPATVRSEMMRAQSGSPLTPREQQVLRAVAQGRLNKQIADELNISLTTVVSHRKNITDKLRLKSVAELTIYAVMHGLVSVDEI